MNKTHIDPICGMEVEEDSPWHHDEAGETTWFCSEHCLKKFKPGPTEPVVVAADAVYTCPMHPEIEQVGPGDCPICGMPLEPKGVTSDTSNEE
jgi:P-type Cu+ transporter